MISYKKMSLFDAPGDSILIHACNAKGVWGSGIAKEFKERFPKSFQVYKDHCNYHDYPTMFPALLTPEENGYIIGCLITSDKYGDEVDSPSRILENTVIAFHLLAERSLDTLKSHVIYSNKFNSGLFKVPWKDTEKALKIFVQNYSLNWVVCDPNLED